MEEDKTSSNDENLEANDQQDGNNEADGEEKGNDETSGESTESNSTTFTSDELEQRDRDIRKDQDKRWKDRLKDGPKKDDTKDTSSEASDDKEPVQVDDRYDRLELKTEGVKVKKEQDAVLDYATFKKISVMEALNSPAIKAELKDLRDKSSTPPPSNRTGGGNNTDDVAYWANQLEKRGSRAPTAEMRTKVRHYLAKNLK